MVYLNGDNDLEKFAIRDINEMERVDSLPESINIICLVDRIHYTDPSIDDTSNEDWDTARIYRISPDNDPNLINSSLILDMGELDMTDSQTLENFLPVGYG